MASFWSTSSGEKATGEVKESEGFAPLPKDWYKAIFESATVDEYEGKKKIKFKTRIVGEGLGKNRVMFLGLKCWDEDEKKRDRAIQLMVKVFNTLGVKLPKNEPDDDDLSELADKPLDIHIDTFIPKDGSRPEGYAFIVNVDGKGVQAGAKKEELPPGKKRIDTGIMGHGMPRGSAVVDDDIPF